MLDPLVLAADVDAIRSRIGRIAAAVADAELQEFLSVLREHMAGAARMLSAPTRANLAQVARRVRYATKQLDARTQWPKPRKRSR